MVVRGVEEEGRRCSSGLVLRSVGLRLPPLKVIMQAKQLSDSRNDLHGET